MLRLLWLFRSIVMLTPLGRDDDPYGLAGLASLRNNITLMLKHSTAYLEKFAHFEIVLRIVGMPTTDFKISHPRPISYMVKGWK